MKKLTILTVSMFLVLSFGQLKANSTITETRKEIKKEKIEDKKSDRPALKKLEGTVVNQDSQTTFYMTLGNIPNISWTREVYFDVASYTKEGKEMKSFFDANGQFVGTAITIKATDLSSSIQKSIKKAYPDCIIGQAISYKDNEDNSTDMVMYDVQFDSQTQYFVEVTKGDSKFVVTCTADGEVNLFKQL